MSAKTKYIFDDQDKCRLSLWETGLVLRCMAAPTGSSIKMPLLIHPTRAKKGRKKGREREREREASKQAAVSSRQFSEGRFGGNDAPLFATALNSIFDAHYSAASCSGTPARIGFPIYIPSNFFRRFISYHLRGLVVCGENFRLPIAAWLFPQQPVQA
jgi:hypothetical protein